MSIIHITRYRMYRLRLEDGRHIFMEWRGVCGPIVFKDKRGRREIEEWYKDEKICDALYWFQDRGEKA